MKKNNKGFTLIELLAVIVILSIILVIATTSVIKNINDSKDKAKYTAASEITVMAEAYMATKGVDSSGCVSVETMITDKYIENDVTNPVNGKNRSDSNLLTNQKVCKDPDSTKQSGYKPIANKYSFDGYYYQLQ